MKYNGKEGNHKSLLILKLLGAQKMNGNGERVVLVLDQNISGIVKRPVLIRIRALDRYGKEIEEELAMYPSRIFQHENDHLEGKEFVELVLAQNPDNLHWVEEDEFLEYRENDAWRTWPKKCSKVFSL